MNALQLHARDLFDACAPLVTDPSSVLHADELTDDEVRRYLAIATRLRDHLDRVQIPALLATLTRPGKP